MIHQGELHLAKQNLCNDHPQWEDAELLWETLKFD